MATSTVEDYIKQIYLEQQQAAGRLVPMGHLASSMGVVPGTATSMIKTLADSGLVLYEPRSGVRLTPGGEQLALHVLRRHRLLELFLVKVLGLDWSEVHDEAEELEHSISEKVLQKIDALLEYPSVDPHGDPIPSSSGAVERKPTMTLADCPTNQPLRVSRVLDQDPGFLIFSNQRGLIPGGNVAVTLRDAVAQSLTIQTDAGEFHVGAPVAEKILVEGQPVGDDS